VAVGCVSTLNLKTRQVFFSSSLQSGVWSPHQAKWFYEKAIPLLVIKNRIREPLILRIGCAHWKKRSLNESEFPLSVTAIIIDKTTAYRSSNMYIAHPKERTHTETLKHEFLRWTSERRTQNVTQQYRQLRNNRLKICTLHQTLLQYSRKNIVHYYNEPSKKHEMGRTYSTYGSDESRIQNVGFQVLTTEVLSPGIWQIVVRWKRTDVSEKRVASFLRIET
jgi:hypothetical protein